MSHLNQTYQGKPICRALFDIQAKIKHLPKKEQLALLQGYVLQRISQEPIGIFGRIFGWDSAARSEIRNDAAWWFEYKFYPEE